TSYSLSLHDALPISGIFNDIFKCLHFFNLFSSKNNLSVNDEQGILEISFLALNYYTNKKATGLGGFSIFFNKILNYTKDLFYLLNDSFESFRVVHCQIG